MSKVSQEGFRRWREYMRFKNPFQAFLRFHLPLLIIFILIVYSVSTLIFLSKHYVFTCLLFSICLWLSSFFFLRAGFINKRDSYIRQFGKAAYKIAAFKFLLPYGALWLSVVSMPLWVPGERFLSLFPFSILGLVVIIAAIFLMHKILGVFGIDRLIYLYNYFPQEATVVKIDIFEFIRHPAYTAWIYLGIGFFLIRGSLTSLLCLILNFIAIFILAKAEEGDIIKDFKDDYCAYQNNVPCFLPRKPVHFLKFLFQ